MRQPEPSELDQVLSRHHRRILAGGWLLYIGPSSRHIADVLAGPVQRPH